MEAVKREASEQENQQRQQKTQSERRPQELERGREAERPSEIPKKGWSDILKRTMKDVSRDNNSIVAAGVAFYAFLSIPAILTAVVSIYGLVANPADVQNQMNSLKGFMPPEALTIVSDQLTRVTSHSGGALTLALIGSIVFALWSGSNSIKALITALNIAYGEREKRGFFKLTAIALLLTLSAVVAAVVAIGLVVAVSALIDRLGLPPALKTVIDIARWPFLGLVALFGLAVAYRYCPSRDKPRWRWVSWGAVAATCLWLVASGLFSWYVSSFGKYNQTYGSLAGIVVLLMWFYISAFVVILGAELNSEMEHQTRKDTTRGEPRPMGERNARVADTLGPAA